MAAKCQHDASKSTPFPKKNGIQLKVSGNYALFSRPEMKVERVSYDFITPSAACSVLETHHFTKIRRN